MKRRLTLIFIAFLLAGCDDPPPHSQFNVCKIFRQYNSWYWATRRTERKWGVPISVQMAIMHAESGFRASIEPPPQKLLGFIPWFRPSSALGYAQAVDATWQLYLKHTGQTHALRNSFDSASDFIGWYANFANRQLGIPLDDAYAQYLAYHEGVLGYAHKSYRHNPGLVAIARNVQQTANIYQTQLLQCMSQLPKKPWWRLI